MSDRVFECFGDIFYVQGVALWVILLHGLNLFGCVLVVQRSVRRLWKTPKPLLGSPGLLASPIAHSRCHDGPLQLLLLLCPRITIRLLLLLLVVVQGYL